jgi:hypothetical protein
MNCPYHTESQLENECKLTGSMYFSKIYDCNLVNDNGTVNKEECEKEGFYYGK